MAIIKVDGSKFENEISNGKVVVDFYADWCGPCQVLGPILDKISGEMTDVKFLKVNVDEEQEIAVKYNIMAMPTILLMVDGQVVDTKTGLLEEEDLKTWINSK